MAVLPIRPTPFFANKNQAFWNLQLAGWGGATCFVPCRRWPMGNRPTGW